MGSRNGAMLFLMGFSVGILVGAADEITHFFNMIEKAGDGVDDPPSDMKAVLCFALLLLGIVGILRLGIEMARAQHHGHGGDHGHHRQHEPPPVHRPHPQPRHDPFPHREREPQRPRFRHEQQEEWWEGHNR